MRPRTTEAAASQAAGGLAGVAGLAAFLSVHALWILPIWFVTPLGLFVAAGGGVCVGWAYDVHRRRLPRSAWARILAVFAASTIVLLPAEPLALTHRPLVMGDTAQTALSTAAVAGSLFLVCALLIGATGGYLLSRSARASAVTALAAVALAIGIGHNAPFIGTGYPALKLWTIMLIATEAASIALVSFESRLSRSGYQPSPSGP